MTVLEELVQEIKSATYRINETTRRSDPGLALEDERNTSRLFLHISAYWTYLGRVGQWMREAPAKYQRAKRSRAPADVEEAQSESSRLLDDFRAFRSNAQELAVRLQDNDYLSREMRAGRKDAGRDSDIRRRMRLWRAWGEANDVLLGFWTSYGRHEEMKLRASRLHRAKPDWQAYLKNQDGLLSTVTEGFYERGLLTSQELDGAKGVDLMVDIESIEARMRAAIEPLTPLDIELVEARMREAIEPLTP